MAWFFKKANHWKSPWISEWISEIPPVGLDLDSGRLYLIPGHGGDFWSGREPLGGLWESQPCLQVYHRAHGFILVMQCWGSVTNNHILDAAPFQATAKRETWSVLLVWWAEGCMSFCCYWLHQQNRQLQSVFSDFLFPFYFFFHSVESWDIVLLSWQVANERSLKETPKIAACLT